MAAADTVLQIVPQLPGTFDGVGDYALNLARSLSSDYGIESKFLVAANTSADSRDRYAVVSGLNTATCAKLARTHHHVVLHYVNYGYQRRGVPFALRKFVRALRQQLRGRWITTFHELYASGAPWKSAFWLRPFQVGIARDMMDVATACVVSNWPIEKAIHKYDPKKRVYTVPVMSNFGEPGLDDFRRRTPKRWTICGGTALIARSLRLLEQLRSLIPAKFAPDHLDIVGGGETDAISENIGRLKRDLSVHFYPRVGVDVASRVLREATFGFLDYFGAGTVWPGMVLKSTAFAALCAHGVIPILAHSEPSIGANGDMLPGPFCLTPDVVQFPRPEELPQLHRRHYDWYQEHAGARQAARIYAEALGCT